jgi:DNA replication factor GINS
MNLDELRSVQRAERQTDSLQHLRDSFYEDVADYLAGLKQERQRAAAAAEDPFASEEVRRLSDEYQSAKEISNALYERRVGKVVKHASFAAADMAADEDGMTVEERELFEDLVERIRENRRTVLARLEGEREAEAADADAPTEPTPDAGTGTGVETEPDPESDPVSRVADRLADEGTTAADAPDTPGDAGASDRSTAPEDDILADALGDAGTGTGPGTGAGTGIEAEAETEGEGGAADAPVDPSVRTADPTPDPVAASGRGEQSGGHDSRPATAPDAADADTAANDTTPDGGTPAPERTTVRITADVGTVYGVDEREYDLAREDVVTLPTTNAEPLLQKDAAERIDFDSD